MESFVHWVDIPARDLARAKTFYATVLGLTFKDDVTVGESRIAEIVGADASHSGCIVQGPYHKPSAEGVLIYLDGGDDLANVLGKVGAAGGKVVDEKYPDGQQGFIGTFIDTEGNKIGLYSTK